MTRMAKPRDEWVRCAGCGHKLFKAVKVGNSCMEIKCHSCKTINKIYLTEGGKNNENRSARPHD